MTSTTHCEEYERIGEYERLEFMNIRISITVRNYIDTMVSFYNANEADIIALYKTCRDAGMLSPLEDMYAMYEFNFIAYPKSIDGYYLSVPRDDVIHYR